MKTFITNIIVLIVLLSLPLWAELGTSTPEQASGAGLELLLYRPFRFAYLTLAFFVFLAINIVISFRRHRSVWIGALYGIVWLLVWFSLTFLAVVELHMALGGEL